MVDRLLSPLISTSDIDNTLLPPYQPLSYFTSASGAWGAGRACRGWLMAPAFPRAILQWSLNLSPLSLLFHHYLR